MCNWQCLGCPHCINSLTGKIPLWIGKIHACSWCFPHYPLIQDDTWFDVDEPRASIGNKESLLRRVSCFTVLGLPEGYCTGRFTA
jgi:hypothetical protein